MIFTKIACEFSSQLNKYIGRLDRNNLLVKAHCSVNVEYVLDKLAQLHVANEQIREALEPFVIRE